MSLIESLLDATLDNNLKRVQELIKAGVNVNQPLEDYDTVLMFAAREGYIDIVKTLVEAGANIDIVSRQGDNALIQAAWGGWQEVFDYLKPLTSLEVREWAQKDALLGAAADENIKALHLLSKTGVDLNGRDDDGEGKTALMLATEFRHTKFVEALIQSGVDVNTRDNQGKTALILAARFRNSVEAKRKMKEKETSSQEALVLTLSNADADLNAKDNEGKNPLIHAVEFGPPEVVKQLIKLGANINEKDYQGMTALTYAKNLNNLLPFEKVHRSRIINLLQEAGAIED